VLAAYAARPGEPMLRAAAERVLYAVAAAGADGSAAVSEAREAVRRGEVGLDHV